MYKSVLHVQSGCFANLNLLILVVLVDVAVVVACRSHEALRNLFLNWHLKKHLFLLAGGGQRSFSVPNSAVPKLITELPKAKL